MALRFPLVAKRTSKKGDRSREVPLERAPDRSLAVMPRLDDVLGQSRAVALLDRAVASGRIHHAWIFQGPEGVGKFTTAVAIARVLLDPESAPDLTGRWRAPEVSEVQRLIDAGTHPDLHVIRRDLAVHSRDPQTRTRKQTNIPIEVVREFLLEPASRSRTLSGASLMGKVLIVDEAHLLAPAGQDAMLKTLEEPPEGTLIILITSQESRLSITVRSRCQRVAFSTLDERSLRVCTERLGLALEPWMLDACEGSPGELARMIRLGVPAWREALAPMIARLLDDRSAPEFAQTCATIIDDTAKRHVDGNPLASKESANREAGAALLRLIASMLRGRLGSSPARDLAIASRIDALRQGEELIAQNVNVLFALEHVALGLLEPAET